VATVLITFLKINRPNLMHGSLKLRSPKPWPTWPMHLCALILPTMLLPFEVQKLTIHVVEAWWYDAVLLLCWSVCYNTVQYSFTAMSQMSRWSHRL